MQHQGGQQLPREEEVGEFYFPLTVSAFSPFCLSLWKKRKLFGFFLYSLAFFFLVL
jgi:hypothetical protein